jgi:putative membrane protein
MGIGMLLFWGLIIFAIVMLARGFGGSRATESGAQGKTALDLLRERYARGEIDLNEFRQKRSDLST